MVSNAATFQLTRPSATRLKRRAKQLGLTPEQYVERLMAVDLEVNRDLSAASWDELVAPFRQALGHLSEDQLDELVDRARRSPAKKRKAR
jgi:hypothetical protein